MRTLTVDVSWFFIPLFPSSPFFNPSPHHPLCPPSPPFFFFLLFPSSLLSFHSNLFAFAATPRGECQDPWRRPVCVWGAGGEDHPDPRLVAEREPRPRGAAHRRGRGRRIVRRLLLPVVDTRMHAHMLTTLGQTHTHTHTHTRSDKLKHKHRHKHTLPPPSVCCPLTVEVWLSPSLRPAVRVLTLCLCWHRHNVLHTF